MAHGDLSTVAKYYRPYKPTSYPMPERIVGVDGQKHPLAVTGNALDIFLDSLARQAVEMLNLRYSRIVTIEADGGFIGRASYPARLAVQRRTGGKKESPAVLTIYQQAVEAQDVVFIYGRDDSLSESSRRAFKISRGDDLCLLPLRINGEAIGLFIMCGLEPSTDERLRLASLIADQAAGGIYQANLAIRLAESQSATVLALAKMLEARDAYTGDHSKKMSEMVEQTAVRLGLSPDETLAIRWAALLHDIGKIGIPDEILSRPGPLSNEEWEIMKRHPQIGADIVLMAADLARVAKLIQSHHERLDGSGYPAGLKGDEIPLGARILSVVDSYSAMVDGRVYHAPRPHLEAAAELQRWSGIYYDPQVVTAFLSLFE